MPTYEYCCENDHAFELRQGIDEDPVEECVECGAPAERQISLGSGLIFRGSGFYETDYGRSDEYRRKKAQEEGRTR